MKNNQRGFSFTNVIVAVSIIVLIAVVGFIIYVRNDLLPPNMILDDKTADTAGWKTYINTEYGFEVRYSPTWRVNENKDSINFSLPKEMFKAPKGEEIEINSSVKIFKDFNTKYSSLEEFARKQDGLPNNNPNIASWNYENLGYENIGNIGFFEYSTIHQDINNNYVALADNHVITLQFSYDASFGSYEKPRNYYDFLEFLSTFKFTEPISASKTSQVNGKTINFEGEVRKDEIFQKDIGKNLVLKLTPESGGWMISVLNLKYPDHDYSMFNAPFHGYNVTYITNSYGEKASNHMVGPHDFNFVLNESEYKKGFDALNTILYPGTSTDAEIATAGGIYNNLILGHIKLSVISASISPLIIYGFDGDQIDYMKFKVEVNYPPISNLLKTI